MLKCKTQQWTTIYMPKIAVNDINIYYETGGIGERLLYISGTGGDIRNKPSIFESPLVDHFEVLTYDQRGFGQTSKPDKPYSMAGYADDAAGLLDVLNWDRCLVIGISFGGMVAQEFALRHTQRIRKLALKCTSSGGAGGDSYPLHELANLSVEEKARKTIELSDRRCHRQWQTENPSAFQPLLDFTVSQMSVAVNYPEFTIGARRQLDARKLHNTWDRLPSLSIPTGIFGGEFDDISPKQNLENLQLAIPGSNLQMFKGGHLFHLQDKNAWPAIISFLKSE